jgi:hypothetical protein
MGPARALLDEADEESADQALEAVTEALRHYEQAGGVYLNGSAWLAAARLP